MAAVHWPWLAAVAGLGVGIAAWLVQARDVPQPPAPAPPAIAESDNHSPFGIAQHNLRRPTPSDSTAVEAAAAPPSQPAAPLQHVRDPVQAWNSYVRVDTCIRARESEARLASLPLGPQTQGTREAMASGWTAAAELCRDIDARQVSRRWLDLEAAVSAGVPGAAAAWMAEGPYGDRDALQQRPDDPLIVEWKERMVHHLKAAASRGDTSAAGALVSLYRQSAGVVQPDAEQALAYWNAQVAITQGGPARLSRGDVRINATLGATLSAEQAAAAIAAGHSIAAAADRHRRP